MKNILITRFINHALLFGSFYRGLGFKSLEWGVCAQTSPGHKDTDFTCFLYYWLFSSRCLEPMSWFSITVINSVSSKVLACKWEDLILISSTHLKSQVCWLVSVILVQGRQRWEHPWSSLATSCHWICKLQVILKVHLKTKKEVENDRGRWPKWVSQAHTHHPLPNTHTRPLYLKCQRI